MVELVTVDTEEVALVSFLTEVAYLAQVASFSSGAASYLVVVDPLEPALALEQDL